MFRTLRTLLKEVKEYKRASIATPVYMILEVAMEMVIPFLMASIIDDGVNAGNMAHIYKVGGIMIAAAFLGLVAGLLGGRYGAKASAGFAKNLREAMFNNIQTYSFANIDKFSTAGLVTRLTTDVTNIQMAYQMSFVRYGDRVYYKRKACQYLPDRSADPWRVVVFHYSPCNAVFYDGIS